VADGASRRFSVVEVLAADRPGLLAALAGAIFEARLTIHSAHIATYGARAVDVFYLAGDNGRKLSGDEIARLKPALLAVASHRRTSLAAA
jgi:[protein-PII] uridylyltransferase